MEESPHVLPLVKWLVGYPDLSLALLSIVVIFAIRGFNVLQQDAFRIFVYLQSTAICLALMALIWMRLQGALNTDGVPVGRIGEIAHSTLKFFTDIEVDLKILIVAAVAILGPQILAYMTLAIWGLAVPISFARQLVVWATWMYAKSLITVAGLMIATACFQDYLGWQSFLGSSWQEKILVALCCWLQAIGAALFLVTPKSHRSLPKMLLAVHKVAIRNVPTGKSEAKFWIGFEHLVIPVRTDNLDAGYFHEVVEQSLKWKPPSNSSEAHK